MEKLVKELGELYPTLVFISAHTASWSPRKRQITYDPEEVNGAWSLLHELGHALLGHESYETDFDLLRKEAEAWRKAQGLAKQHGISIDPEHIQQCLDTYRDWLYKRSICPTCGSHGIQRHKDLYGCLNCRATWKVSSTRFCRPYRLRMAQKQK